MRQLASPAPHWRCYILAAFAAQLGHRSHGKLWRVGAVVDDDLALQVTLLQLLQHAVTRHVICNKQSKATVVLHLLNTYLYWCSACFACCALLSCMQGVQSLHEPADELCSDAGH